MDDSGERDALSWEEFFARFSREDVPNDFLTEADRNQGETADRKLFDMVDLLSVGALADAWESVASGVFSPDGPDGKSPCKMRDASEAIQEAIVSYIAATKDTRLLSLLYLLSRPERRSE